MSASSELAAAAEFGRVITELERVADAIARAWIGADDLTAERIRFRGEEARGEACSREELERLEGALSKFDQVRDQARQRVLARH